MKRDRYAVRQFYRKLTPELSRRYGRAPYSPLQVERTVRELKLSERHLMYAQLMFCKPSSLNLSGYTQSQLEIMKRVIVKADFARLGPGSIAGLFGFTSGGVTDTGDGGGFESGD